MPSIDKPTESLSLKASHMGAINHKPSTDKEDVKTANNYVKAEEEAALNKRIIANERKGGD